jgi:hypothetical protein
MILQRNESQLQHRALFYSTTKTTSSKFSNPRNSNPQTPTRGKTLNPKPSRTEAREKNTTPPKHTVRREHTNLAITPHPHDDPVEVISTQLTSPSLNLPHAPAGQGRRVQTSRDDAPVRDSTTTPEQSKHEKNSPWPPHSHGKSVVPESPVRIVDRHGGESKTSRRLQRVMVSYSSPCFPQICCWVAGVGAGSEGVRVAPSQSMVHPILLQHSRHLLSTS